MSKQYQKKSASRKKRGGSGHGPTRSAIGGQSSGLMGGMISGFRRAVGSEETKGQAKGGNLLWAALLVTAALAIVAWNFAR
jgi:hypothetical protein